MALSIRSGRILSLSTMATPMDGRYSDSESMCSMIMRNHDTLPPDSS